MRGYFGIGVERINKMMNLGSLFRSAHAFGASFLFTVDATYSENMGAKADTSAATGHVPYYNFPDPDNMVLPADCELVGVELVEDALELPSFRHPQRAAYILGPERGSLGPEVLERCAFTVKIPTKFCVNVGIAGAIVMYDRTLSLGRFPARPVTPRGEPEPLPEAVWGDPVFRRNAERFRRTVPAEAVSGDKAEEMGLAGEGSGTINARNVEDRK